MVSWCPGVLEDGSGGHRHLEIATAAAIQISTRIPARTVSTSRTAEPVRPAHLEEILATILFSCEPRLKIKRRPWKILHSLILHIVDGRVNRIALFHYYAIADGIKEILSKAGQGAIFQEKNKGTPNPQLSLGLT